MRKIYALVATSGCGKDEVLAAILQLAKHRLGSLKRYTTRELRHGDHYLHASMEQMNEWEKKNELVNKMEWYGAFYITRRDDLERVLKEKPIVTHLSVPSALKYREQGYDVVLSRLLAKNRQEEQILDRVKHRLEHDEKRQDEMRMDVFNGPDIINDFLKSESTVLLNVSGFPIPAGAVQAAQDWLAFIAKNEGWPAEAAEA